MSSFRNVLASGAVFCASLLAQPNDAIAQSTSLFSGHVTDSHGQPISGATVEAGIFSAFGFAFLISGQATTDADGNYAITALDATNDNQYTIAIQLAGYAIAIYPGISCYSSYCLQAYQPTYPPQSGVDFVLLRPGSITGKITLGDTGAPIALSVSTQRTDKSVFLYFYADATGNYKADGLLPGTYFVSFNAYYGDSSKLLSQRYAQHDFDSTMQNTDDAEQHLDSISDSITVQEGGTVTGVNFSLHEGVMISGTLTSAINAIPIAADISVLRPDWPGSEGSYANFSYANFGQNGNYSMGPFVPGTVYVQFAKNDDYLPLFYPQAATQAQAQLLTLSVGNDLTGIDAQLTPSRSVAGTVTDASTNQPLSNVTIHIGGYYSPFFMLFERSTTTTDMAGNYFLQGLDSSGYYMWATGVQGHIFQFYPAATPCCNNPTLGATVVSLADSEKLTGIDFALSQGAYASGRIFDPLTNGGLANAHAQLYTTEGYPAGPFDAWGNSDSPASGSTGNYVSSALPPGSYYLTISLGTVGSRQILYPNIVCPGAGCDFPKGQLLDFNTVQEYPGLDFAIPNLDLIFRGGFDP